MYRVSNYDSSLFSIKYKFDHSEGNLKNYFEEAGKYSNEWNASGNWDDLYEEQQKFESGRIRVVINEKGSYERNATKEEEVKKQLREDVYRFRKYGSSRNIEREFKDVLLYSRPLSEETLRKMGIITTYRCPQQEPQTGYSK